jgi:hypothetical protein
MTLCDSSGYELSPTQTDVRQGDGHREAAPAMRMVASWLGRRRFGLTVQQVFIAIGIGIGFCPCCWSSSGIISAAMASDELQTMQATSTATATQWQPWETTLAASGNYENPYTGVELAVNYTAPDGEVRSALGFWDGGAVWRIRSYFDRPGRWQWQTTSNDPGLTNQSGIVAVASAETANSNPFFSRGRLLVGQGYLKHADQSPFFWLGDTAWAGPMRSTESEWAEYLANRKQHGFTAVQSGIACPWAGGTTRRGDLPFTDTGNNLTKLNPAFFQVFADRIAQASEAGFAVLIVGLMEPSYRYPTPPEASRFARHLTARLAHYNSLIFSPSFDSGYMQLGNLVGMYRTHVASVALALI